VLNLTGSWFSQVSNLEDAIMHQYIAFQHNRPMRDWVIDDSANLYNPVSNTAIYFSRDGGASGTEAAPAPLWATDRRRHGTPDKWKRYTWRRRCHLTYKQVTATHQSLSLSSNTSCKHDTKSQGWNTSSLPEGVNAKMSINPSHYILPTYFFV